MVVYLASPLTHPDPDVREYRYKKACRATAVLMKAGVPVFSPLLNSIPAVELGGLESEHDGFLAVDLPILRRCDEMLIVGLEGWTDSEGVKAEMFEAFAHNIPVTMIEEKYIELLPKIPKTAWHFLKTSIFEEVDVDET